MVSTPADGFGGLVQRDLSKAEQGGALDGPPSALRTNLEITTMYGRWVHSESQFPFPCYSMWLRSPLSHFREVLRLGIALVRFKLGPSLSGQGKGLLS